MIICDQCGCKIEPENNKEHMFTKDDPYGQNTDWCPNCFKNYARIREEVGDRIRGIYDRAVARRWMAWKSKRTILEDTEDLFS